MIEHDGIIAPDDLSDALTTALIKEVPGFSSLTLDVFLEPQSLLVASRVMEAMPVMVAALDNNLLYLYANQKYVKTVNSPRPSWKGLTVHEYMPPYLLEHVLPRLERAVRGEPASYYIDIVPADGITRTVLVCYQPIGAPGRRSDFFIMTGIDATELKTAQQRLFATQKLETIAHLTSGIAHDFNNQLGVVVGSLSLLERQETNARNLRLLQLCKTAAERCTKLTSQLLAFGGKHLLQPRAMLVSDCLRSVVELVRVSIPDNVTLQAQADDARLAICVDPTQMNSLILNLVLNARDAMPTGGKIAISTTLANVHDDVWTQTQSEPADFVCIQFCDDGIGMDAETARRAFEPFFTTKPRGSGSGMGLAMVYGFVKQSGGHVDILTAPMRGTTIRVYLPRAERAEHYKRSMTLSEPAAAVRQLILVVEDEPAVSSILCELLHTLGHLTRSCDTAADAMKLIAAEKIEVVLTDIHICGPIDGLRLREMIHERYPHIRVICTSGYSDPRTDNLQTPPSDIEFLPKPIHLDVLAATLSAAPAK